MIIHREVRDEIQRWLYGGPSLSSPLSKSDSDLSTPEKTRSRHGKARIKFNFSLSGVFLGMVCLTCDNRAWMPYHQELMHITQEDLRTAEFHLMRHEDEIFDALDRP